MKKMASISLKLVLSLFLIAGLCVADAAAQTVSGTLRGTVSDPIGALVPNATVTVRSTETGLERTVTTNDEGLYNLPFLPIGNYTVEVTRTDFSKVTREKVRVSLNETTVVNVQLNPSVTGEVTVTDTEAPINTTDAQITQSLSAQMIEERPVANRTNFLSLAETFTGFQENPTSGQNNPTASSGSSINFNGTGTRGATFQIDGVNNDDSSENQNRQGVNLAAIKEFQVITNNFTAEFGRGYGAVVLVQTKSGTNSINGEAYLYHNNSDLNAKSFFSHGPKAVNRRNQYGGVVGFPIWRNRIFGFLSVDEVRNSGDRDFARDVFTVAEHNPANWFDAVGNTFDTPGNRAFIQSVLDRFGDLRPNDPNFARVFRGTQGFSFPQNDYSARFDFNLGPKDTVTGRWQYSRQIFETEDVILGENGVGNHKQQNYGLTWTHIFAPSIVGEFRYGLGKRNTLQSILAGNDTPIIRFTGAQVSGSIIGNTGAWPILRWQTDHQFVYNLSAVFGSNHFFKAGIDIRKQKLDDFADNFSRGFWSFGTTCNSFNYGSGFRAFLNGCVTTFTKGYGPFFLENRIGEKNFYVEDNWKVLSNLTLNLGLRYEYVDAPSEAEDLIDYGFDDDKDNWGPRLGFAYSPSFSDGWLHTLFGEQGSSSIRGGYGLYHGRIFQSIFSQNGASIRGNPPNAISRALSNQTNLQDPSNGFVFVPGVQTARHSIVTANPDLEMPYTQQWNLSFERQMPWDSKIRVSYTGNRGIGLLKYSMGNTPRNDPAGVLVSNHPNNNPTVLYTAGQRTPGDPRGVDVRGMTLRPASDIVCAGTGLPGLGVTAQCPVPVTLSPTEYSFRVPRTNERRPDGLYTTNLLVSNGSWSYYDALQVDWSKRLSQGLNFQAAYTWSKSIDTTSEATFVGTGDSNQNGNDARALRGHSRFHTPHRFTLFGTYRTPWFDKDRGILGHVLGGWNTSLVFKWVHGTPFSVINSAGTDLNFDSFAETRPVILDPSLLGLTIGDRETSVQALPRSAFRSATAADFGVSILGRNTFYTDGLRTVDLAFAKSFGMPWSESHQLHIRADLFNAFNKVQWGFPINDIASASFGQITGFAVGYAPRTIQLSLRYTF